MLRRYSEMIKRIGTVFVLLSILISSMLILLTPKVTLNQKTRLVQASNKISKDMGVSYSYFLENNGPPNKKFILPLFTGDRYIFAKTYLPLVGSNVSYIKVHSFGRFDLQVVKEGHEFKDDFFKNFHSISFIFIIFTVLIISLYFASRKKNKIFYPTIMVLLAILIFYRTTILESLSVLALSMMCRKKILTSIIIILTALLSFLLIFNHQNDSLRELIKSKNVLTAAKKMKDLNQIKPTMNEIIKMDMEGNATQSNCSNDAGLLGLYSEIKFHDTIKVIYHGDGRCEFSFYISAMDAANTIANGNIKQTIHDVTKACAALNTPKLKDFYLECIFSAGYSYYDMYPLDHDTPFKLCKYWGQNTPHCDQAIGMRIDQYYATKSNLSPYALQNYCLTLGSMEKVSACMEFSFRFNTSGNTTLSEKAANELAYCDSLKNEIKTICDYSIGDSLSFYQKFNLQRENFQYGYSNCKLKGKLNLACLNNYISTMSFYHGLNKYPVKGNNYCENYPGSSATCLRLVESQYKIGFVHTETRRSRL